MWDNYFVLTKLNFPLTYTITNRLLRDLKSIAAAKQLIDNAYILPQWEIKLRENALLSDAHHSTRIEGNTLTLEQVSRLAKGRQVMASRKDRQEVLNYLRVLNDIHRYATSPLSETTLLRLHRELTTGTMDHPSESGAYRDIQVVVGSRFGGKLKVSFVPPKPKEVPTLVRSFLRWLKTASSETDPVLLAGLSNYELVRIHPFIDGNGRTARAFATMLLLRSGFDIKRFFSLDDYYDSKREDYYKALQSVDPAVLDVTQWLEYFVQGVNESVQRVKTKVMELSRDRKAASLEGQVYLSKDQMRILELVATDAGVSSAELVRRLKKTRQAVHKDISRLMDLELITRIGSGPKVRYVKA